MTDRRAEGLAQESARCDGRRAFAHAGPLHRPWAVYTLHDPRVPELIRYVGKTHQTPRLRLKRHRTEARGTKNRTHCTRWVRTLLAAGIDPVMTVVETGHGDEWAEVEKKWIADLRACGMPLTNLTDGGEGTVGWQPSEEDRRRRGVVMQRTWATDRERMCEAIRASHTAETRALKREVSFKRQADPLVVARQSAAQKKSWDDPEIRQRRVEGLQHAQADPNLRATHADRTRAMWADPVQRAKRIAALRSAKARKPHSN